MGERDGLQFHFCKDEATQGWDYKIECPSAEIYIQAKTLVYGKKGELFSRTFNLTSPLKYATKGRSELQIDKFKNYMEKLPVTEGKKTVSFYAFYAHGVDKAADEELGFVDRLAFLSFLPGGGVYDNKAVWEALMESINSDYTGMDKLLTIEEYKEYFISLFELFERFCNGKDDDKSPKKKKAKTNTLRDDRTFQKVPLISAS